MTNQPPENRPETAASPPEPETRVPDEILREHPERVAVVREALEAGDLARVRDLVLPLHYADLADLIEALEHDERIALLDSIRGELDPDVLPMLEYAVRDEVVEHLGPEEVAAALGEMDTDDAMEVVQTLDAEAREEVLDAVPADERAVLEQGLTYPEESAGRLMQRELVSVPADWTVGQTIDHLRNVAERDDEELPDEFYDIYVVDARTRLVGRVSLSRLLRSKRPVTLQALAETELRSVPVDMDQEEVALLFRQYALASAPVVDQAGRLVGVITVDDIVDIIHEEAEEDILLLGGVSEGDLYEAAIDTAKSRFPWLAVNLATALLAANVIGLFEATIEKVVALAVLMPIVASMGGNAGTQTMTVAVRALATKELSVANALHIVWKEAIVGGINGLLFAVLIGVVAWAWFGDLSIGLVIAAAMTINLLVAGFAGVAIPLALERGGVDPAVASAVFLTTVTDVVGFFAFLGLASLFVV
ncbi:MAG TPA: magnesium transporter [Alphaproteobacteria bacterium]|jgi:magnesium transporter